MSLEDAVDLVLFAFEHGNQGDLFVNKAPASTIGDLAEAIKDIFKADNEIKVIGTRHGEKLYETLCTREEMQKAEDMGEFYRIPADNRDLNYSRYFSEGETDISAIADYHSHNTTQLTNDELKQVLLNLYVQNVRHNIYYLIDMSHIMSSQNHPYEDQLIHRVWALVYHINLVFLFHTFQPTRSFF